MRITVLGLLIFLLFALVGSVPLLLLGNTYLRCERRDDGTGRCEYLNGSLLRGQRVTFPLEELSRAEFRRTPRRSSNGRFDISPELQVVLLTERGELPLGAPTVSSTSRSYDGELSEKARRIETFRTSTWKGTLKEGDDNTLMIVFFLLVFGGMGAAAGLLVSQP